MLQVDDELLVEYLAESREHLANAETDMLAIEAAGEVIDQEKINRVFRGIHTVKGGAGFFELLKIGELAHHAENVLDLIRSHKLAASGDCTAVLLRSVDCLTEMIGSPADSNETDIDELVWELKSFCGDGHASSPQSVGASLETSQPLPGSLRMLLAEDDLTNRLVLQSFLSSYGECHVTVNGKEAVEAVRLALERGQEYDLICMDILMPEMTGREAVQKVRALEEERGICSSKGAKIVMTTSISEIGEVFRCFKDLCDSYLTKPIDLGELLALMKTYRLVA